MSKPQDEWKQTGKQVQSHYSALTLHRKCPQAWLYKYDMGLRRDETETAAPPRDFGSWFGALQNAEALERGRRLGSLIQPPGETFRAVDGGPKFEKDSVTVEEVVIAAGIWWEKLTPAAKDVYVEWLGEPLPDRLVNAFAGWMDAWAEQRKYERPLAVELFWERTLPTPPGDAEWDGGAPGLDLRLIGFIDYVYEDTRRDIVVVEDFKTMKQMVAQSAVDDMMDSQLDLYVWGATPLLKKLGAKAPRAVAFNRTRSVAPTPPQLTATGNLSKSVTMFDARTYENWSATDTTPTPDEIEDIIREKNIDDPEHLELMRNLPKGQLWGKPGEFFVTGAKKGQPKFGVYEIEQEVIDRVSTPAHRSAFYQRPTRPVSINIVRSHLRSAVDTATDIYRTQTRAERTGEAARNFTASNCRFCDYASLCRAQMIGGPDGEYELAEHMLVQKNGLKIIGQEGS